jgi:tight adherence protein B
MTMTPMLATILAAGLAFIAVAALGLSLAGNGREKAAKRVKAISEGATRTRTVDSNIVRKKEIADSVKGLRIREDAKRRNRTVGKSIDSRIKQAGLNFTVPMFWMGSAVMGAAAGAGVMLAGFEYYVAAGAAFAAGLGIPRWLLKMAISMRQKKFIGQFSDAIDVIVRGVKSGLPLSECLKVIARESPQPLAGEFERVVDSMAMGASLDQALNKLFQRTPIQEVNFFNIVLAIQAKAGGNLSEALGNLSAVLRSRKLMREKIKALSSEAKASAMIIGSLPIIVILLVYATTPDYIMQLFITDLGNLILLIAVGLMSTGIYIMRSMINFNF